jgi:NADH dehydrogenase FAD-containing subunit
VARPSVLIVVGGVILVEAGPRVLSSHPEGLSEKARRLGIQALPC